MTWTDNLQNKEALNGQPDFQINYVFNILKMFKYIIQS